MGTLLAALSGAAVGAAAYALEGAALKPVTQAAVLGLGGAAAGVAASGLNKGVGAGIAAGGASLAALALLRTFMESKATAAQTSRIRALNMGAVRAQLPGEVVVMRGMDAVRARVGNQRVTMR
jgi:hypothetical protein